MNLDVLGPSSLVLQQDAELLDCLDPLDMLGPRRPERQVGEPLGMAGGGDGGDIVGVEDCRRGFVGQQIEEDLAKAVNIGERTRHPSVAFWRRPGARAAARDADILARRDHLGKPEIDEHRAALGVHDDVVRLQVAVVDR